LERKQRRASSIDGPYEQRYSPHTLLLHVQEVYGRLLFTWNKYIHRGRWGVPQEGREHKAVRCEKKWDSGESRKSHLEILPSGSGEGDGQGNYYHTSTYTTAITNIEPVGIDDVWDIEVEEDHSYGACGFWNHNSSSNPNTQNLPGADADEFKIRWSFRASPGNTLIIADYAQAEIRLIAHLSGDRKLKKAILSGDIYRQVYSEMFGMAPEEVTSEERKLAKVIVLGTNYGMGPMKLEASIADKIGWENTQFAGISNKFSVCKTLLAKYFETFPDLDSHLKYTPILCRQETPVPCVRTLLGRYRRLPDLIGGDIGTVKAAERESINTGPQGGVADLLRGAMIQIEANEELQELECELLLQIHDEIVLEVPKENALAASKIVRDILEHPLDEYGVTIDIPLDVDMIMDEVWKKA
jgi:hypothetical protein